MGYRGELHVEDIVDWRCHRLVVWKDGQRVEKRLPEGASVFLVQYTEAVPHATVICGIRKKQILKVVLNHYTAWIYDDTRRKLYVNPPDGFTLPPPLKKWKRRGRKR